MFDFFRTHQRLMQFVLLIVIVPAFALVGLEGYTRSGNDADVVARVDKKPITKQEFDIDNLKNVERLQAMVQGKLDAKMLDSPELRQRTLDQLIAKRVLLAEAERNKMSVSDTALQQLIMNDPNNKGADGQFEKERYYGFLAAQGLKAEQYDAILRSDMLLFQVSGAIENTSITPKSLAARLSDISDQELEVQEIAFKSSDFVPQVKVTDAMLKDFYEKNGRQFEIPEQVKIEYAVLTSESVAAQTIVPESEARKVYETNIKLYTVAEQRRVSHILINAKKDASAADKAAAKSKADSLLAQLRKAPGDFAKLAKEHSQDTGTASTGGDLDFLNLDKDVVKPFKDAAEKLKKGEISDVVQTDDGYHIIQVTDLKPGSVKAFDEVKDELLAELKKKQVESKYKELAKTFVDTVFEKADSLKPAADLLKLKIETASNVGRTPNRAVPPGTPYNDPKFLKALFLDDIIKNKNNTEAIEITPGTMIAGRVVEHKPVSKVPFEQVKAVMQEQIIQAESVKLAKAAGEAKLAALKKTDETTGFAPAVTVSRTKSDALPAQAMMMIVKADTRKLPALVGVEMDGKGYSIYRINKVSRPAVQDAKRRENELKQVAQAVAQQETSAYVEVLKKKSKVKILQPVDTLPNEIKDTK